MYSLLERNVIQNGEILGSNTILVTKFTMYEKQSNSQKAYLALTLKSLFLNICCKNTSQCLVAKINEQKIKLVRYLLLTRRKL